MDPNGHLEQTSGLEMVRMRHPAMCSSGSAQKLHRVCCRTSQKLLVWCVECVSALLQQLYLQKLKKGWVMLNPCMSTVLGLHRDALLSIFVSSTQN